VQGNPAVWIFRLLCLRPARADSLEDYATEAGAPTYASMTAELDRLENLLQQMLRLARAEEASSSRRVGLVSAVAESTDLDDLIRQRISFWQPVADGQHQRLHYDCDHPGLAVQLARHNAEQLLDVALDNALRYDLDPPSMIQTGRIPLHPGAITAFDALHG
jgi:signal transduction histidine kinase